MADVRKTIPPAGPPNHNSSCNSIATFRGPQFIRAGENTAYAVFQPAWGSPFFRARAVSIGISPASSTWCGPTVANVATALSGRAVDEPYIRERINGGKGSSYPLAAGRGSVGNGLFWHTLVFENWPAHEDGPSQPTHDNHVT